MIPRSAKSCLRVGKARPSGRCRSAAAGDERGVALVITLLLLTLMSALGLVMVLGMSSDMLINGYYRNYRGAFYAADSGLNVGRAQLVNQTVANVPTTPVVYFAAPPIANPTTMAAAVLSAVTTAYNQFTSVNSGQSANSWAENFEIANTVNCNDAFTLAAGYPIITANNAAGQATAYRYIFNYTLCSTGRSLASQQVITSESGSVTVNITANSTSTTNTTTTTSFAAFGAFVNNYPPCLGPLVPGTMTGPMFTNGAWQFMTGGAYIFTDPVGQSNAKADYWFGGTCIQSATSSYKNGNQTIAPTFQGGLNLGQPTVAQPANAFSQQWAAVDGLGQGETDQQPTNADLNAKLKNISGTAYPTGGTSTGVYLPYSSVSGTNTITGGGFYVQGNASVVLSIGTDGSGNPTQIYTITQGSTTTTITTDTAANSTTVKSGATTLNLAGVPKNLVSNPATPAALLYVTGNITGLAGTGQGVAAIQDGTALSIVAGGNIAITGDVVYKTEPVTTTQNQNVPGTNPPCCNGSPVATLIPGHDNGQVLGIYTNTGNIQLSSPYSNKNLQVDGSLAAVGSNCNNNSCGFTVSGSINTFNNVGGQIQTNIFAANMNTENTYFDRRFTSNPGFAPPWFPSTSISTVDITTATPLAPTVLPTTQRITWLTTPQ